MRRGFIIVPLLLISLAGLADGGRAALLEQRREQLRQKWEQQFRAADRNQDRGLSAEELREARLPVVLNENFDAIDKDQDGRLSPDELLAAQEQRVEAQQMPRR